MTKRLKALEQRAEQHRQILNTHRQDMELQWHQTRENMTYIHDFTAALAQRFSPGPFEAYTPFSAPLMWPTQAAQFSTNDEMEDDNEMVDGNNDEF